MPSHTSKEVLILFGSLSTCDPGDIAETIGELAQCGIRCSVIGLSAEVRVCRYLTQQTKGIYDVILDDGHYKDLLMYHLQPPPAIGNAESSLIRMGFPQYVNEGVGQLSMCVCHMSSNTNYSTHGYLCPQCNSKYCELPVECQICGLTLVSASHLARSYHHLFPVDLFKTYEADPQHLKCCYSCQEEIKAGTSHSAQCQHCEQVFCVDCDVFIHETLHFCPGCASSPSTVFIQ